MHSPFDDLLDDMTEIHPGDAPSLDPDSIEHRIACLESMVKRVARVEYILTKMLLAFANESEDEPTKQ
jgi:hypothetical protein